MEILAVRRPAVGCIAWLDGMGGILAARNPKKRLPQKVTCKNGVRIDDSVPEHAEADDQSRKESARVLRGPQPNTGRPREGHGAQEEGNLLKKTVECHVK
jgi:hypothetical protein